MSVPPVKSARFLAIETLCRLHKTRLPVTPLFETLVSELRIQSNDRQLAKNILYGTLRKRQSIDRILKELCRQPLGKIKPFVYQALSVGIYQLLYLDRIPESAAVNESVKALQAAKLPKKLQGFVNGVLRNVIRQKTTLLPLLNTPEPPILNHPRWLTDRWQQQFGKAAMERICNHNNRPAHLALQVNSSKTDADTVLAMFRDHTITVRKGLYCDTSLILEGYHGAITGLPGFNEGFFQVQDQGAQLLTELIQPVVTGGEYLDACAGVGGKTSSLIQLCLPLSAQVTAVEPDGERRKKFRENLTRLHPQLSTPVFSESLQDFARNCTMRFHGILLDAPCSGTGVTGRHPDIRWNRRADDLLKYQKTQLELLHTAAKLLHPEGILLYATCSLEKEENTDVVKQFLATQETFTLETCAPHVGKNCAPLLRDGNFHPLPDEETDGFFAVRLRRKT